MSRRFTLGFALLLAVGFGGCVVHGRAAVRTAEPPPPVVVVGEAQPEPPPPTVVGAPEPPPPTVVADPHPASPPPPTVVGAPTPPSPPPPTVVGAPTPPVTPPPPGVSVPRTTATQSTIDRPSVAVPEAVGIPPCTEEGSTNHCPSGMVCAVGTDQVLGCRLICQADANCGSGERCIPTARVNRNICLVP